MSLSFEKQTKIISTMVQTSEEELQNGVKTRAITRPMSVPENHQTYRVSQKFASLFYLTEMNQNKLDFKNLGYF